MTEPEASNSYFAWVLLWSCQSPKIVLDFLFNTLFKTYFRDLDRSRMVSQVLYALLDGRSSPAGQSFLLR
jgi:hypothetical protein